MTYPDKLRTDLEQRTRAVLYDFRKLLTEEEQEDVTTRLTERFYAIALHSLRRYLIRHAQEAKDEGVKLQIQLRLCDIAAMMGEIEPAPRAEEAKPKDDGFHPEVERRMLSVLDDVRSVLTVEEQGDVRRLLDERHYAPALHSLRDHLSRRVLVRKGGGDVAVRLRDIDTMIRDYAAGLMAKVATNPPTKVDDRLARIEGALNEIKATLAGVATKDTIRHWMLVIIVAVVMMAAGAPLLR